MAAIELIDLKKNYGPVPAVKGINLTVADGEMIVLVGPSGCGKSTLLRMIAGLEAISSGHLRIAGSEVGHVDPADRDIAMVFQNYALYPHMTVRQNLEYGLKNRRVPRHEIDRRIADAADILEIGEFLERRPRQLSGGQRQRVAMGRAIVRNPAAFLFDEPLSNLDAKLRLQMRVEIRRLQRQLKTTSLYVTHDQLEAMTLADRLVVMNGGRIEQVGTPIEVYRRPETVFVAGFIGSPPMNLVCLDELGPCTLALPRETNLIGIRPGAIKLGKGAADDLGFDANVELIETVGDENNVHLRIDGTDKRLVASVPSDQRLREGDRVTCYVGIDGLHPFNTATGRRTD
ncbi:sn-glycerol-3-phosphate import ATP-binding protein UgpC [Rhizobium lentis]|uniref:sn-glycerol-3-phosphate import ATP-binding protein UgpC n=1 Tax=Rhizobium lentis TaxID=1138194 RepID=UPI001A9138FA|nr:sn-glycerol-3-phosphate import ATP-binding protein UgpC [Rhizobium lentis]MBX4997385.1 sn-glycerol-3-phosphate import ATP-binding protein UgpC [Rhizobium lentis]MBX5015040.1 sn-glycerol-3-phosphate import ATP-binding protein UgpC [Rhizobium lentis]MBX5064221.1 sn-glycerol-3-phosphate import ATP-binding protein UgpC [Rhizobium lentis]MBX5076327.1 sn-glycerol-3-phosphate import ATP-binding protein UgpC [Rhizobium lentis]MBX5103300.1 sn-glycerol-3-phosphate import ATP-binding protein UgpC [Rhi